MMDCRHVLLKPASKPSWKADLIPPLTLPLEFVWAVCWASFLPKASVATATPKITPGARTPAIIPICQPARPVFGFGGGGGPGGAVASCDASMRGDGIPPRWQTWESLLLTELHSHFQDIGVSDWPNCLTSALRRHV